MHLTASQQQHRCRLGRYLGSISCLCWTIARLSKARVPECLSFDVCFFAPDSPHRTRQPHSQQKPSNVLDGALVSRKRRNGSQTTWPDVPPKRGATGEPKGACFECGMWVYTAIGCRRSVPKATASAFSVERIRCRCAQANNVNSYLHQVWVGKAEEEYAPR